MSVQPAGEDDCTDVTRPLTTTISSHQYRLPDRPWKTSDASDFYIDTIPDGSRLHNSSTSQASSNWVDLREEDVDGSEDYGDESEETLNEKARERIEFIEGNINPSGESSRRLQPLTTSYIDGRSVVTWPRDQLTTLAPISESAKNVPSLQSVSSPSIDRSRQQQQHQTPSSLFSTTFARVHQPTISSPKSFSGEYVNEPVGVATLSSPSLSSMSPPFHVTEHPRRMHPPSSSSDQIVTYWPPGGDRRPSGNGDLSPDGSPDVGKQTHRHAQGSAVAENPINVEKGYQVVRTTLGTWLVISVILSFIILVVLVALLIIYKSGRRHHGNGSGLRWVRNCTRRYVDSGAVGGPDSRTGDQQRRDDDVVQPEAFSRRPVVDNDLSVPLAAEVLPPGETTTNGRTMKSYPTAGGDAAKKGVVEWYV